MPKMTLISLFSIAAIYLLPVAEGLCSYHVCDEIMQPWKPAVQPGNCSMQFSRPLQKQRHITKAHSCPPSVDCRPRTIVRKMCLCPRRECRLQPWTQWADMQPGRAGDCKRQYRERKYSSSLQYQEQPSGCQPIRTCPGKSISTRIKPTTCPSVAAPKHGPYCSGTRRKCGDYCYFVCDQGFSLEGRHYVICGNDGKWNGSTPTCKDVVPPRIACPGPIFKPNDPGRSYAVIDLPVVNATDNSGAVSVSSNPSGPVRVFVGQRVGVTYTATDAAGNMARCILRLEVEDREPPRVISCPSDFERTVKGQASTRVTWQEPQFRDNVNKSLSIFSNRPNGDILMLGKHIIIYKAVDRALNSATCTFTVTVREPKYPCGDFKAPKNGSVVCMQGDHGMSICGVACQKGFQLVKPNSSTDVYEYYICAGSGTWHGIDRFMITPLAPAVTPWPSCSDNSLSGVKKHFATMQGSCNEGETIAQLKTAFSAGAQANVLVRALLCNKKTCAAKDAEVIC